MSLPDYRPGLLADIVRLHADYYAREWNFGLAFEAKVARELSEFSLGFRAGIDFFAARFDGHGALLGTISVEGPRPKEPLAPLRRFITSVRARGTGLGRSLMLAAMERVDGAGFPGTYLTTFAGLHAARHLYDSFGFVKVAESHQDQWSGGVVEQRFERSGQLM